MKKIALLYWGTGGNVERASQKVYSMFDPEIIDMVDVVSFDMSTLSNYKLLIFGGSTIGAENWIDAKADNEWNRFFRKLEKQEPLDFIVAFFGLGDQVLYPDHFVDGLGVFQEEMDELKVNVIGQWPVDGYKFTDSDGIKDNHFYGLALDIDNEPVLTDQRIKGWTDLIKQYI
ncbi:MAG: flavodoxin domain-containing protein [Bacteroidales bacterium]|nr:flavodoxin domain-containing protein [Bacteroidales bacterium]